MLEKPRPFTLKWGLLIIVIAMVACIGWVFSRRNRAPLSELKPLEGAISIGEEYFGAAERLQAAGAFEITNVVHFYAGMTPYSLAKMKDGQIFVSSHLLVYTPHPSEEIRGWFLLPDNTCVSLFVRKSNASRITTIEVGGQGRGFQPPADAIKEENLSPAVDPDPAVDGISVTIHEEEKAPDLKFWSSRVEKTVERLWLNNLPDAGPKGTILTTGMPLRLAARILADHAAEDISSNVEAVPSVNYAKGKYPRTIPDLRFYILPGNTLVVLRAKFDPLLKEQFTVEKLTVGEPGVGYPGKAEIGKHKFTNPESLNLMALVQSAGPLHFAAQTGDLNAIQKLLREQKATINDKDREGSTPLHLAVKRGRLEAARTLLESGADVNAADSDGDTPLILAAEQGRSDLVALLLDHRASAMALNKRKSSAFLAAGRRGEVATIELLLDKHHADANQADENGFTLLHRAAGQSNTELTRVLLKHGANPNVYRSDTITPLWEAAEAGAVEVVRLLLEAGANTQPAKADEWRALDAVAASGSVEIARMLIARGAKPDGPALYAAANSGHAGVVRLFIEHGADLKYTENIWQRTVLHTAHSAEVVRVLVRAGMDIEVKNKIGETPLHEAAHFAPHEVVVALLELGADPHAVSNWKKTPLQMAETRDRPEKEEILKTLRTAISKVKPEKAPSDKK